MMIRACSPASASASWRGVLVDLHDHAAGVLELVDRVLELAVEDDAVGDHHDLVEDLAVLGGVERREPMGRPGDRVRLARAGRVLDEVGVAGAVGGGVGLELQHRVPLVVAGEDDRLGCAPSRDRSLLGALDVDEAMEDVEPGVLGPDPLPEVRGLVAVGVGRIALAEVVAEVEGQEPRRLALQLGGHRDRIGVDREVDERAPPERDVLRIAVVAVLLDRVLDVLAGEVVLQLRRRDRNAVEEQAEVDRLVGVGVEGKLARDGQPVGVVVSDQLGRDAERGLAIREADLDVLVADAVAQDIDRPPLVDLLRQSLDELLAGKLFVAAVGLDQLRPLRSLRQLDEREELDGVEAEPWRRSPGRHSGSVPSLHIAIAAVPRPDGALISSSSSFSLTELMLPPGCRAGR